MRTGLLVRTGVVLLLLAAAPTASADRGVGHVGSVRSGSEPVPPRLMPAARALLHARRSQLIAHLSRSPGRNRSDRRALPRIVGGTGAVQGQFGFMALLVYFDSNNNPLFLCSGTLVSSNVVLTAGHCATDESSEAVLAADGYRVVTGAVDWTNAAHRSVSHVSRVVVNPEFGHSGGVPIHDAAALVLSSPVSQPTVPLWSSGQVSPGQGAAIAGWGETSAGQTSSQHVLQWARTIVQGPPYCSQFDPGFQSSTQLCTVDPPSDSTGTCNGDSGGPLLAADASHQLIEIGVTSVGPADCDTTTADYFTAVLPIEPWVRSVARAVRPALRIPKLSFAAARVHVRQTLTGVLGSVFAHRQQYNVSCSRESRIKLRCEVSFTSGRSHYFGAVTIAYVLHSGRVRWTDQYVVHRATKHCYFHSGHRSSCQVQTRSGSF